VHTITTLRLEDERRRAGISLEQIASYTKISTQFLRAVESEEFEKLPGGVFNTSYIRQYAAAIGYSAEEILALYYQRETARAEEQAPKPQPERRRSGRLLSWLRVLSPATRP
jgi:cytoskeleton protein RodZ